LRRGRDRQLERAGTTATATTATTAAAPAARAAAGAGRLALDAVVEQHLAEARNLPVAADDVRIAAEGECVDARRAGIVDLDIAGEGAEGDRIRVGAVLTVE